MDAKPNYQVQFLDNSEDVTWLFDTHLSDYPLWRAKTKSFVLEGNEDCAKSVELYDTATPEFDAKPFVTHAFWS